LRFPIIIVTFAVLSHEYIGKNSSMVNNEIKKSKTPWGWIVGIGCGLISFIVVAFIIVAGCYVYVNHGLPFMNGAAEQETVDPEDEWIEMEWNEQTVKYKGPLDSQGRPHGKGKMRIPQFSGKELYDGTFNHGVMEGKNVIYYGLHWNFEGEARDNDLYKGKWISNEGIDFYFKGTFRNMRPYNGTWYLNGAKRGETVNGVDSPDDLFM